jgi:hypothetical protein
MTDVYEALAQHLDNLPAGYPRTESGVEMRILKRLFLPQEAEVATLLTMMPEAAGDIAERSGRDVDEVADQLAQMAAKGLIFRTSKGTRTLYSAAQFVVGIWEYHVNDLDEDLIRDVNEYMPTLLKKSWQGAKTKQLRVVPVAKSVSAGMAVMPFEAAEEIIKKQSNIVVAPCICRKEQKMIGNGCE